MIDAISHKIRMCVTDKGKCVIECVPNKNEVTHFLILPFVGELLGFSCLAIS